MLSQPKLNVYYQLFSCFLKYPHRYTHCVNISKWTFCTYDCNDSKLEQKNEHACNLYTNNVINVRQNLLDENVNSKMF